MKITQINFESYDLRGNKIQNTATVTIDEHANISLKKIAFAKPVKHIDLNQLHELCENTFSFIESVNAESETTIGDVANLPEVTTKAGLLTATKAGGFDKLFNFVFGSLQKENKNGRLTENEQKMVEQSKKLIEQLTGKK